ncbi:hypothetical protein V3H18_06200 [Methylocystis sp. 9N]|uniref:Uncharacterized protein n=1 Tax=Methylocystis borbori TaxID=3118750 RepID=A0ABU7XFG2_9HYPH
MLIADLVHSCSNDKVAQAALACIGGCFAERVRAVAHRKGVSVGRFVVVVVRDFARRADETAHEALRAKIMGDDQPLLKGLREVLESALEREPFFVNNEDSVPYPPYAVGAACDYSLRYH